MSGHAKSLSRNGVSVTVVAYDVADDRTRVRIAEILLGAGGRRIQKSVFELFLGKRELGKLRRRLRRLRGPDDSIVYYTLCRRCQEAAVYDETGGSAKREGGEG